METKLTKDDRGRIIACLAFSGMWALAAKFSTPEEFAETLMNKDVDLQLHDWQTLAEFLRETPDTGSTMMKFVKKNASKIAADLKVEAQLKTDTKPLEPQSQKQNRARGNDHWTRTPEGKKKLVLVAKKAGATQRKVHRYAKEHGVSYREAKRQMEI